MSATCEPAQTKREYRDKLAAEFTDAGEWKAQVPTGILKLTTLALAEAAENVITEMQRQARAMGEASDRIMAGMGSHSAAITKAATASDTYSKRLVWATWSLVLVAIAQIIVTLCRG